MIKNRSEKNSVITVPLQKSCRARPTALHQKTLVDRHDMARVTTQARGSVFQLLIQVFQTQQPNLFFNSKTKKVDQVSRSSDTCFEIKNFFEIVNTKALPSVWLRACFKGNAWSSQRGFLKIWSVKRKYIHWNLILHSYWLHIQK